MTPAQTKAMEMLRADPRRDLYETANLREFMVTYSDGESPTLSEQEMQDLWAKSLIRPKYPNQLEVRVFVTALSEDV